MYAFKWDVEPLGHNSLKHGNKKLYFWLPWSPDVSRYKITFSTWQSSVTTAVFPPQTYYSNLGNIF